MIKLEGIVLNVFTQQGGQNKKRRNIRRPRQGSNSWRYGTSNGGVKNELFTLSVENYRDFKDYLNQKNFHCSRCNGQWHRNVVFMSQKVLYLNS